MRYEHHVKGNSPANVPCIEWCILQLVVLPVTNLGIELYLGSTFSSCAVTGAAIQNHSKASIGIKWGMARKVGVSVYGGVEGFTSFMYRIYCIQSHCYGRGDHT